MSLDQARSRDSWCWPKGARPLGTRMAHDLQGTSHPRTQGRQAMRSEEQRLKVRDWVLACEQGLEGSRTPVHQ